MVISRCFSCLAMLQGVLSDGTRCDRVPYGEALYQSRALLQLGVRMPLQLMLVSHRHRDASVCSSRAKNNLVDG